MSRAYQLAIALCALAFVFGGGWWLYSASSAPLLALPGATGEWTPAAGAPGPAEEGTQANERVVPAGFAEYANDAYGFSLLYPQELEVREYEEGGGAMTMTFEGGARGEGFQIFALPYNQEQVSEERFRMDVPSGVMEEPVEVLIGGVRANAFWSTHALLGETREVWFIRGGYLFEVTARRPLDPWLAQIMSTWRFR